jgi:multiple sugar transport system substrate-binding protein
MKKKYVLILALLVSVAMVFPAGQQQAPRTGPVTIRYAFWGNPDAIGVEQEIIDAFHAANPDIRVEAVVSPYGDYHTRLFTLIAGGTAPDVMRIDSYYIQDFVEAGVLLPLDNRIRQAGINLDDYYTQGILENRFNGQMWGLPWGTAPLFVMLNLDVFEQHGVPLPSLDWTIQDFERILRAFQPVPNVYGYALSFANISSFYPFIWGRGGDIFDETLTRFTLDQPESAQAIQQLADWYRAGLMPQDIVSADLGTYDRWFINGNVAMMLGAASNILTFQRADLRFEAWPLPTGTRSQQTTFVKSNTIGISATSRQQEAAWRFLEFLRAPGQPGEELYMRAQRMPPTIRGEQYWSLYADPNRYPRRVREVADAISNRFGRGMRIRSGLIEIERLVLPELQRVFLGQVTAQDALRGVAPQAQQIMNR